MATSSKSKHVSSLALGIVWAIVVAAAAFLGLRAGFSGRHFAVGLGVAAALFAFELLLALPSVQNAVLASLGNRGGILAPIVPLFAVLDVLVERRRRLAQWMLIGAAYAVIPALLLASSRGRAPGTWEDYAALVILWLPVEFRWMYRLFPYPSPLTHTLTILMALSTGVAAFVLLRRMPGVGYALEWRRGFAFHFGFNFLVFSAIAIPLGLEARLPSLEAHAAGDSRDFALGTARRGRIGSRDIALSPRGRRSFCFEACCRTCSQRASRANGPG